MISLAPVVHLPGCLSLDPTQSGIPSAWRRREMNIFWIRRIPLYIPFIEQAGNLESRMEIYGSNIYKHFFLGWVLITQTSEVHDFLRQKKVTSDPRHESSRSLEFWHGSPGAFANSLSFRDRTESKGSPWLVDGASKSSVCSVHRFWRKSHFTCGPRMGLWEKGFVFCKQKRRSRKNK